MTFAVSNWQDGVSYTGALTANSPITFRILGGKYFYYASAPSTSSALNILLPDEATYVAVSSSTTGTTSAVGPVMIDLPAGSYEIVLVATGAVQGFLVKIPYQVG